MKILVRPPTTSTDGLAAAAAVHTTTSGYVGGGGASLEQLHLLSELVDHVFELPVLGGELADGGGGLVAFVVGGHLVRQTGDTQI